MRGVRFTTMHTVLISNLGGNAPSTRFLETRPSEHYMGVTEKGWVPPACSCTGWPSPW